ncbi:MAG: AI-2E family transporter [Novosphingobium sp.]
MIESGGEVAGQGGGRQLRAQRTRQLWLTAAVILLALWLARPFLTPLAWAAVLAIAEWPLYRRCLAKFPGHPTLVALGLTLATALLVVLPLSLAAVKLAQESANAFAWLQHVQHTGLAPPPWLGDLPLVGARAQGWWQQNLGTPQGANELLATLSTASVLGWTRSIGAQVAQDSALFLVTLVALGCLLASGRQLARHTRRVFAHAFGRFGTEFVERMAQAVRATVMGTVLVSVGEGALIGVGYVVAGVPQPLLFTVFTIVFALIPFGAWLAFALASAILLIGGNVLVGALLFGFGAAVMTIGDNLVQPKVIGSAVELPFLFAFVGAFGGLAEMGLVGLFVGPVIMAAVLLLWREWLARDEAL